MFRNTVVPYRMVSSVASRTHYGKHLFTLFLICSCLCTCTKQWCSSLYISRLWVQFHQNFLLQWWDHLFADSASKKLKKEEEKAQPAARHRRKAPADEEMEAFPCSHPAKQKKFLSKFLEQHECGSCREPLHNADGHTAMQRQKTVASNFGQKRVNDIFGTFKTSCAWVTWVSFVVFPGK